MDLAESDCLMVSLRVVSMWHATGPALCLQEGYSRKYAVAMVVSNPGQQFDLKKNCTLLGRHLHEHDYTNHIVKFGGNYIVRFGGSSSFFFEVSMVLAKQA